MLKYNYKFIHNALGDFYKDILDYISETLYPRFNGWKVIGTYHKAVEYLNKQAQLGREADMPNLPAIILNPSGDFKMDDTAGNFFWRYPTLNAGMAMKVFPPIYQDPNVTITVGYSRIKGEIEIITILPSVYEYLDLKMYMTMMFGGEQRFIYPRYFNSFIILPREIYEFQYNNEYTGEHYQVEIPGIVNELIRTTNHDEVVYPLRILPRYRIINMQDASTRYGGTDSLPEWKLSFTLEYETNLPSFILLASDMLPKTISLNIKYGSCYSANEVYNSAQPPEEIRTKDFESEYIYDSTSKVIFYPETDNLITDDVVRKFKARYYHIVTKEEAESIDDVFIDMPEPIDGVIKTMLLYGKNGIISYGNYTLTDEGTLMDLKKTDIKLDEGEILEIYVYIDTQATLV